MEWLFSAVALAGLVIGFAAGASPSPTGGSIAGAVSAFLLGILAGAAAVDGTRALEVEQLGQLAICFLLCLFIMYVAANILRKNGGLVWMGIGGRG